MKRCVKGLSIVVLVLFMIFQFSIIAGAENYNPSVDQSWKNDKTPPTTPQNLQFLSISENAVTFTWDKATDDVAVFAYVIFINGERTAVAMEEQYTHSLGDLTKAVYQVAAIDFNGNESPLGYFLVLSEDMTKNAQQTTSPYTLPTEKETPQEITSSSTATSCTVTGDGYPVEIDSMSYHNLLLTNNGEVWAWGMNAYGQLGDSGYIDNSIPNKIDILENIIYISAGWHHSTALDKNGDVWTWGRNHLGQLGDGTVAKKTSPIKIVTINDVIKVEAGQHHTLALKRDGTVWAWGYNNYGQLGDGTILKKTSPTQISGLSDIKDIFAGYQFNFALADDGTVWAWGLNNYGQLGDGTQTTRLTPVQITSISDIEDIALGLGYALCMKTDGTVWGWGRNSVGQLGDGTNTGRLIPVNISALDGVKKVIANIDHNFAIDRNDNVFVWGKNNFGQLGNGTETNSNIPIEISSLSDVNLVTGGYYHSVAVKTSGELYAWGDNTYGQLADGKEILINTPQELGIVPDISSVYAGADYSFAGEQTDIQPQSVGDGLAIQSIENNNGEVLLSSYSEINKNWASELKDQISIYGQCFTSTKTAKLSSAKFFVKKGVDNYNIQLKLYALTGTYGTDAIPTGTPLAVSEVVSSSDLPADFELYEFVFTGDNRYQLQQGGEYGLAFEFTGSSANAVIYIGSDSSPTYDGNRFMYTTYMYGNNNYNYCHYIYGVQPVNESEYSNKYDLVIDRLKIDATLTGYPVKVLLNTSNFDFSHSLNNGNDIIFTDTDGYILDFEMVYFDSTNLIAEYHVEVPSVSSSIDTEFYMYIGKTSQTVSMERPEYVWDDNFGTVVHMGYGTLEDSTGNGTVTNGGTILNNSSSGKDRYFDGTDYITVSDNAGNDLTKDFTILAVVSPDDITPPSRECIIAKLTDSTAKQYSMDFQTTGLISFEYEYNTNNDDVATDDSLYAGYNIIQMTLDTSLDFEMYLNGNSVHTDASLIDEVITSSDDLNIGRWGGTYNSQNYNGYIREIRVCNVVRSDAWIKADYHNLVSFDLLTITDTTTATTTITPNDYFDKYDIAIDSSKVDSTLTDYPVKVLLNTGNFNFSKSLSNGLDIVFTSDSNELLDFEMVYFDAANSIAEYYVKIQTISSSADTEIYMYTGKTGVSISLEDSTAVWDSNYLAVWHLANTEDSTNNNFDLTAVNSPVSAKSSTLGSYYDLTRNDSEHFTFADIDIVGSDNTITILAQPQYFYTDTTWQYSPQILTLYNEGKYQLTFGDGGTLDELGLRVDTGYWETVISSGSQTLNEDVLLVLTTNEISNNCEFFVDGSSVDTGTLSGEIEVPDPALSNSLGGRPNSGVNRFFDGYIYEVQISNIVRSDAWIKADYHNLMSSDLLTITDTAPIPPIIFNPNDYVSKYGITIDNTKIDSSLTDYPVKVLLNSSNFDFTKSLSNGLDIAFTDDSNELLDFEMVYYDAVNSIAEYHVKMSSLSSSVDTEIHMYTGKSGVSVSLENPEAVWNDSYKLVLHMDDTVDSTSNSNDGTVYGTTIINTTIGKGRQFDGIDDYIEIAHDSSLNIEESEDASIFAVVQSQETATSGNGKVLNKRYVPTSSTFYTLQTKGRDYASAEWNYEITEDTTTNIKNDLEFHNFGFTVDTSANQLELFLDGIAKTTMSVTTGVTNTQSLYIGNLPNYELFTGIISEVRIAKTVFSDAWLKADYNNLCENNLITIKEYKKVPSYDVSFNLYSWGDNQSGQTGIGNITKWITEPTEITGFTDSVQMDAGYDHVLALKSDGSVWAWGNNIYGELGVTGVSNSNSPVSVSSLTDIAQVAAGTGFSFALKSDGTVYSWGHNDQGQLGDGTLNDKTSPSVLAGLEDVVSLAAGSEYTLFLKDNGTVWACGDNTYGQLGSGNTTDSTTPVQISGLSDITKIYSGDFHSFAVKEDGTVWTWGQNTYGQLGDGTTTNRTAPIQISSLINADKISLGKYHSMAIKSDGSVVAWGKNTEGQLGDGTYTDRHVPANVSSITNATDISCGGEHSLITVIDGSIYVTGSDRNSQLGLDRTVGSTYPLECVLSFGQVDIHTEIMSVSIDVSNISSFTGRTFTITYDTNVILIDDLSGMTWLRETGIGYIPKADIDITSFTEGTVVFTVNKTIPANTTWSGTINIIHFKKLHTGDPGLTLNMT